MKKPANSTVYKMSITGSREYTAQIKACKKAAAELEIQLKKLAKMKITPIVARVKRNEK